MDPSLQALRKQVEKETAQGHSWDTVVQLRMIQELIEVSSQVALLNKVLSEILEDSRIKDARYLDSQISSPGSSASIGTGGSPEGVSSGRPRGRPRKGS